MYVLIENSHGTVMCCSLKAVTKLKKKNTKISKPKYTKL